MTLCFHPLHFKYGGGVSQSASHKTNLDHNNPTHVQCTLKCTKYDLNVTQSVDLVLLANREGWSIE